MTGSERVFTRCLPLVGVLLLVAGLRVAVLSLRGDGFSRDHLIMVALFLGGGLALLDPTLLPRLLASWRKKNGTPPSDKEPRP